MLTISPAKDWKYYQELAKEDYYLNGGEPPGEWVGEGAKTLGLEGEVTDYELKSLMKGFDLEGNALVQNAGDEAKRSAFDLTFSADKSISVAWSIADRKERKIIEAAHKEAVNKTINFLEKHAVLTRRGKGSKIYENAKLVSATFLHGTNREQEPHLHTHALFLNVTVREDGTTGSLEPIDVFRFKKAGGALYRAELSKLLQERLTLESVRIKDCFRLKGIPDKVIDYFSTRRKQVLEAARRTGYSSQKALEILTLSTRNKKELVPRNLLFSNWKKELENLKFTTKKLNKLFQKQPLARDIQFEKEKILKEAVGKALEHESHFGFRDIVKCMAVKAQGRTLGIDEVVPAVENYLKHSKEIVRLRPVKGEARYTTKEVLEIERELLGTVKKLSERDTVLITDNKLDSVFKKRPTITAEQREAVEHITRSSGAIKVVSGMAGTGKSFMLGAVREALQLNGSIVLGLAPTGRSAKNLEISSEIKSKTIHKLLADIKRSKVALNQNTVLIVDEAGLIGTKLMHKLISLVEKSGASISLIGDIKQLQPVNAGAPTKGIIEQIRDVKLTDIRRQNEHNAWAKNAIIDFREGRAKKALDAYIDRGLIKLYETRADAISALVKEWETEGVNLPKDNLILSSINSEVVELNRQAQALLEKHGKISGVGIKVGEYQVFEGDRIIFTENSEMYGVTNGTFGTIKSLNPIAKTLKVELDDQKIIKIKLSEYSHIKLGYAVTTYKAQGETVENAYVLVGGNMQDRETTYVQSSRAKNQTRFFTDKIEAGKDLSSLIKSIENSRQKDLATSLLPEKQIKQQIYLG